MSSEDRAILVGISRYPGLEDLDGPENDANDFAAWLRDPAGGAVPDEGITLILSSHYPAAPSVLDAQPTTEALVRAFAGLWDEGLASRDGRVGRRLYIFMAGHGFAPDLKTAALLMANAAKSRLGLHIPGPSYADRFRQAGFFAEIVLLMDCCRDNLPQTPVHQPPFAVTTSPQPANYFYGFATTFSRRAREEPDADGRVAGIFTRALLAGLRGEAAQPATGLITGASLAAYLYNVGGAGPPAAPPGPGSAVPPSRQDPELQFPAQPEIIWVEGAAAPPSFTVRVSCSAATAGRTLQLLDGTLAPVTASSTGEAVVEWQGLAPGLYIIEVEGGPSHPLKLIGAGGTVDVPL